MYILSLTGHNSEARATKILEKYLYNGSGDQFLGWDFGITEIIEDGSEKVVRAPGCRTWKFSNEKPPAWWSSRKVFDRNSQLEYMQPLWRHICGAYRGLVVDDSTTHVPFIAADLDRHSGNIHAAEFSALVRQVVDICTAKFPSFRISAEINPNNGSSKLFLWPRSGQPLLLDTANRLARQLWEAVLEKTGQKIEVFPHNRKQLRLPLHPEKLTIIGSGLLGTATRRKGHYREQFEAHSTVEFLNWLRSGHNFDQKVLYQELRKGCDQLPDSQVPIIITKPNPENIHNKPAKCRESGNPSLLELRNEPDSLVRQLKALLIACRRARRVISLDEALSYIEANRLYTGEWHVNEAARRCRVASILKFIGQTFDPKLCSSGKTFSVNVHKYKIWAGSEFPSGMQEVKRKSSVSVFGEVKRWKTYVTCTPEDVATWMTINEFCRSTCELNDGGVPEKRAKAIWKLLYEDGQVTRCWSKHKWRLIRDRLHERKVVICDYICDDGKAYCYEEGPWHPGRKWPTVRKLGVPGHWKDIEKRRKGERHKSEGNVSAPNSGFPRPLVLIRPPPQL